MKLTGNTILITGGASGIGRGFAEAFHKLGNQVIIAGRRRALLDAVTEANPGMRAVELDINDPDAIKAVAASVAAAHPALNVLFNNAGIMPFDDASGAMDDAVVQSILTTNLLGPIRMTSALIEHLKAQPRATIINNTSVLAFMPLASTAVYSASKAALHAYTLSQRFMLRETRVTVQEMRPLGSIPASSGRAVILAPCRSTPSSTRPWRGSPQRSRRRSWSRQHAQCAAILARRSMR